MSCPILQIVGVKDRREDYHAVNKDDANIVRPDVFCFSCLIAVY